MKVKLSIITVALIFYFTSFVAVKAESREVITQDGGVAASWVLTGAFIIIGALISFIIYDMKRQFTSAMSSMIKKIDVIDSSVKEHSILHGRHDERFKTLFKELNQ